MVHPHAHKYANDARWQRIRKVLVYLRKKQKSGGGGAPKAAAAPAASKPTGIRSVNAAKMERIKRMFTDMAGKANRVRRWGVAVSTKKKTNPTGQMMALFRQKTSKQGKALFGKRKLGPRPKY